MDIMKLESKLMNGMVSKALQLGLRIKFGYRVGIKLNNLNIKHDADGAHIHLDVDANMSEDELKKLLKNLGLD